MIRPGTPVSEISGRDLPSPAEIRGDTNVLLLPYYQEVQIRKDPFINMRNYQSSLINSAGMRKTTNCHYVNLDNEALS